MPGVLALRCAGGLRSVGAFDAEFALIRGIIRRIPVAGYPAGGGRGCFLGTDIACCGAAVLSRFLGPGGGVFLCGRAVCALRPLEGMRCGKPPVKLVYGRLTG